MHESATPRNQQCTNALYLVSGFGDWFSNEVFQSEDNSEHRIIHHPIYRYSVSQYKCSTKIAVPTNRLQSESQTQPFRDPVKIIERN